MSTRKLSLQHGWCQFSSVRTTFCWWIPRSGHFSTIWISGNDCPMLFWVLNRAMVRTCLIPKHESMRFSSEVRDLRGLSCVGLVGMAQLLCTCTCIVGDMCLYMPVATCTYLHVPCIAHATWIVIADYRMEGNSGEVFNLVNWWFCWKSPNLKPANIVSHTIALCRSARDRQI